jgi:hypothetical protein
MAWQLLPVLSQRVHWTLYVVGLLSQKPCVSLRVWPSVAVPAIVGVRGWAWRPRSSCTLAAVPWTRLSDAVRRYKGEPHCVSNSYEWYRRDAARAGTVSIGRLRIPAQKRSGAWFVSDGDLDRAIGSHRKWVAERRAATIDYDNQIIHSKDRGIVETDWGHYEVRGAFHLAFYAGFRDGRAGTRAGSALYVGSVPRLSTTTRNVTGAQTGVTVGATVA